MWRGYNGLNNLDYNHIVVNHAICWGFGAFTTNHIEGFWGVLKKECLFNEGYNCTHLEEVF